MILGYGFFGETAPHCWLADLHHTGATAHMCLARILPHLGQARLSVKSQAQKWQRCSITSITTF